MPNRMGTWEGTMNDERMKELWDKGIVMMMKGYT